MRSNINPGTNVSKMNPINCGSNNVPNKGLSTNTKASYANSNEMMMILNLRMHHLFNVSKSGTFIIYLLKITDSYSAICFLAMLSHERA